MMTLKDLYQNGDWKAEKHVPVIEAPDRIVKGETVAIAVAVGKQIPHPNTTEHHISWIEVYFLPDGEKVPYQIGRYECAAHGSSTQGPNTSTVYTVPSVSLSFKTEKSGVLMASSFCNIHGLWHDSKTITVS